MYVLERDNVNGTRVYTYILTILQERKVGKNCDLNELHCRTFLLPVKLDCEYSLLLNSYQHIFYGLIACRLSSFYGDTLHCKILHCFPFFMICFCTT